MPYSVKKIGKQFCVCKESTGKPVPGGCHGSSEKAHAHMRALYANVKDSKKKK